MSYLVVNTQYPERLVVTSEWLIRRPLFYFINLEWTKLIQGASFDPSYYCSDGRHNERFSSHDSHRPYPPFHDEKSLGESCHRVVICKMRVRNQIQQSGPWGVFVFGEQERGEDDIIGVERSNDIDLVTRYKYTGRLIESRLFLIRNLDHPPPIYPCNLRLFFHQLGGQT